MSSFSVNLGQVFHIEHVLQTLREVSVTAKPSKCMFSFKEFEFLSHVVWNGKIRPLQEKNNDINNMPAHKTKKQIRSFIGILQKIYHPTFCRDFSHSY